MGLTLITPPVDYPVNLVNTKLHLRVDSNDEDDLIQIYMKAAVDFGEQFTGRAFCDQTWELVLDAFPDHEIRIPKPPLIEVVSVKYDDSDGLEATLSNGDYDVDVPSSALDYGWIVPNSNIGEVWPNTFDAINAVRIRFRAGYLSTDSPVGPNTPFEICAAFLLMVGSFYENREDAVVGTVVAKLPLPAENLLRKYRVLLGMD